MQTDNFVTPAMVPDAAIPDHPSLAADVELVGEFQDSGFEQRQWLVVRGGRFLQLSELLYRVVEQIDGQRTLEEIAAAVGAATDRLVTAENVRQILRVKLVPLGLVALGKDDVVSRPSVDTFSPVRINLRRRIIAPRFISPIADRLRALYWPPLLVLVVIGVILAQGWLFLAHGVGPSIVDAFSVPGHLLVVLLLAFVAAVFHELGHATALRYGGGAIRGIGVGFYLIYPTFYTDVTEGYRLSRGARLRTSLGGFYFHLIFTLGLIAAFLVTRQEYLLLVVLLIDLDIVLQCLPYGRLDGYWALIDLCGIPDLYSQLGPLVQGWRRFDQGSRASLSLKPRVTAILGGYLLIAIPTLAAFVFVTLKNLPSLLTLSLQAVLFQVQAFETAQQAGDMVDAVVAVAQTIVLMLPVLGTLYLLGSLGSQPARALWSWSDGAPKRRIAVGTAAAAAIALIGVIWYPDLPFVPESSPPGVQSFTVTSRRHVEWPVAYPQNPPVGGDHAPIWLNCGYYAAPIPKENAVHSLEHGAVWITYRPDLPPREINALRQMARREGKVIVSPYPELPAPVVASAWGRQLQIASTDDSRLQQFVRDYEDGRQAPERGGPCSGGVGQPN